VIGRTGAMLVLTMLGVVLALGARPAQAQIRPGGTLVEENRCEGELCRTQFRVVLDQRLRAYQIKSSTGRVVFTAVRGDTVDVDRIDVVHTRLGSVRVLKAPTEFPDQEGASDTLARGETLVLLSYGEVGYYYVHHKGHEHLIDGTWEHPPRDSVATTEGLYELLDGGSKETWYLIRDRHGRSGWTRGSERWAVLDPWF
jgi:hypothetical protein